MSVSLYRKYRPETFEAVVGQEHIEKTLTNAVEKGTVSHAYLFCGPRGTGKTTTARLLAKALLCEQAPTAHPDGTCELCQEVAGGSHPDVYELDAASRTGVDSIRTEVIDRVAFAPTLGTHKIYIFDEVHMLSTGAFNALLKSIEEPPKHVIFVLCTTDPHKVPPTVQSRCQRFDFHRLTDAQIAGHLRYICTQEGFEADERALELIAARSLGGMRDAITSLETVSVYGDGAITFEGVESMLGDVSSEQLEALARYIAMRDLPAAFSWISSFVRTGTDITQLAKDLAAFIRDVYVISLVNNPADQAAILALDSERLARYEGIAHAFGSPDRLAYVLTVLGDLMADLKGSINTRLTMEIALTRLARPQGELTLEALADRVAALETRAALGNEAAGEQSGRPLVLPESSQKSGSPVLPASAPPEPLPDDKTPASDAAPVDLRSAAANTGSVAGSVTDSATIRRVWMQAIDAVKKDSKLVGAMLSGSEATLGSSADKLLVQLPGEGAARKQTLESDDKLELVRRALHKLSGRNYDIEYVVDDAIPMPIFEGASDGQTLSKTDSQPGNALPNPERPQVAHTVGDALPTPAAQSATSEPPLAGNAIEPSIADVLKSSFGEGITIEEIPAPTPTSDPNAAASATAPESPPATNPLDL
jgi:DNA polymerase-3 subunit gamma/tau